MIWEWWGKWVYRSRTARRGVVGEYEGTCCAGDDLCDVEALLVCPKSSSWCCCPTCGGVLYRGPCGGASVNMGCDACGARYNMADFFVEGRAVWGERLSDALVLAWEN